MSSVVGSGRGYQDTISGWKKLFEQLESQGRGDELIACAFWTKELVEENLKSLGYDYKLTDEQWQEVAHNIEDSWSAFEEDDRDYIVDEFEFEYNGI